MSGHLDNARHGRTLLTATNGDGKVWGMTNSTETHEGHLVTFTSPGDLHGFLAILHGRTDDGCWLVHDIELGLNRTIPPSYTYRLSGIPNLTLARKLANVRSAEELRARMREPRRATEWVL